MQQVVELDTAGGQSRSKRIDERKKRVVEKRETMRRKEEGQDAIGGPKERELGLAKTRVIAALRTTAAKRSETDAEVEGFKVQCMQRERARREVEEHRRQDLRAKMLDEAEASAKANADVAAHWSDLFNIEVPQDLWVAIQAQQEACAHILESKDTLIKEMKQEVKQKDDGYTLLLKQHAMDIDAMIEAMARQFEVMAQLYESEGAEVDKAYMAEQSELMERNLGEIKALLEHRREREDKFQREMEAKIREYDKELEATRVKTSEDHNQLKVRLTQDQLNLERHMQAMAATFQLNQEKLEYNRKVLGDREHENRSTRESHKRRKHRQIDILSQHKQRYAELDRKYQEENRQLTEEYKRITELFKELQHKFKHFEEADLKVYQEVRVHNDQLVAELVRRVLEADKVIHEQQLGLSWRPPGDHIFRTPWEVAAEEIESGQGEQGAAEEEDREAARQLAEKVADPAHAGLLALLEAEAVFLVDARVRGELERLGGEERSRRTVRHILDALGVTNGELFDRLVQALTARVPGGGVRGAKSVPRNASSVRHAQSSNSRASSPTSSQSRVEADDGGLELVHPNEAVAALKTFVEKHGNDARNIKAKPTGASRVQVMTKRMREKEREYWAAMGGVVSERGVRVWQALEKALQRYHRLLKTRAGDLQEVQALQGQNKELRALLGQYLSSKVNEELQLPPAHIL